MVGSGYWFCGLVDWLWIDIVFVLLLIGIIEGWRLLFHPSFFYFKLRERMCILPITLFFALWVFSDWLYGDRD